MVYDDNDFHIFFLLFQNEIINTEYTQYTHTVCSLSKKNVSGRTVYTGKCYNSNFVIIYLHRCMFIHSSLAIREKEEREKKYWTKRNFNEFLFPQNPQNLYFIWILSAVRARWKCHRTYIMHACTMHCTYKRCLAVRVDIKSVDH